METLVRGGWLLLALIHVLPALVLFAPDFAQRLYGVDPDSDIGVLIVHRGALFLAVLVVAVWAAIARGTRTLASVVLGISMTGFLYVYWRAGMPEGSLRIIAIADLGGIVVLGFLISAIVYGPRR